MGQLMQQQIGVACFMGVLLIIALTNLRYLKDVCGYLETGHKRSVSILVPARNEADNIADCVRSLAAQSYPDYEIVVLDDGSTDGTGRVIEELERAHPNVRSIRGRPPPPGWLGKNWACDQLARAAEGSVLLFTDADTRHEPGALTCSMNAMDAEQSQMVTVFPREETITWSEKLSIPILAFSINCFMPLGLVYNLELPSLSPAIGQYMLVDASAYRRAGGHSAVRGEVLDDFRLAGNLREKGYSFRLLRGASAVGCRMYEDLSGVAGGFGKNLFSVFGCHVAIYTFIWVWMAVAFLEPLVLVALGLAGIAPARLLCLSAANIGAALVLWSVTLCYFGFPLRLVPLYPAIVGFSIGIAFFSMGSTLRGANRWKDRDLPRPKIHWI